MSELRRILSLPVLFAVLITFAFTAHAQQTLRVAAAADLQPLLPAILAQFTAQTGIQTEASYKSSATLATSIINGAPFDLFLAADLSFPQKVIDAGLAEESKPIPYARGTLVLWTRNDTPFKNLSYLSLTSPELKSLAIANPQHAPYGRAAMQFLETLSNYNQLKPKLVVAENIAQTAQYAESGNAQMGFISLTSALTPQLKSSGHYIPVPRDAYPPILQGAVIIKNSHNAEAAQRFLNFLASAPIAHQLEARGLAPAH
ncbi:MAG: molybdate ABC transporter substrate-binding protein [Silvibacterium sp.]